MDSRTKSKSACEKAMQVAANIIWLSSLFLAQKTLRSTTTAKARNKDLSRPDYSHVGPEKEPSVVHDQFLAARRSQGPRRHVKLSYVMDKPVDSNHSTTHHVIHEERIHEAKPRTEESIDELASQFIRKMRSKLACGL